MKDKIKIPLSNFKKFIIKLAIQYHIQYKKTKGDVLADSITELSDDIVEEDDIERLIVSLNRNKIINSKESLLLHYGYLKESLNV